MDNNEYHLLKYVAEHKDGITKKQYIDEMWSTSLYSLEEVKGRYDKAFNALLYESYIEWILPEYLVKSPDYKKYGITTEGLLQLKERRGWYEQ